MSIRKRPLRVFLCHDSSDMPRVHELHKALIANGVKAWLEQDKLLPGQNRAIEVPKAVQEADIVVICLSKRSITTEGNIQKDIRFALDVAAEKLEDSIFIIPARLEECDVPRQINRWTGVDLFREGGYQKLISALRTRAETIKVRPPNETAPIIQIPAGPSSPDIQKPKITLPFIVLLVLIAGAVIFMAITAIRMLTAKYPIPTTGSISLSDAMIEFEITTSVGTQTVRPFGVLTLHQGDQVNIETKVSGPNDVPYSRDLKFKYFLAPGKSFSGKVAPYTANQSRLISVEITDQATSETITRTFRINVD